MVEIADIQDEKSLEAWLEAMPGDEETRRKNAVALAHRAAMRVLPVAWQWFEFGDLAQERELTAVPILRASLSCWVAGTCPTQQLKEAAANASAAAVSATAAAATIAVTAATAATAAAAAAVSDAFAATSMVGEDMGDAHRTRKDIWAAFLGDCDSISKGNDLGSAPLWQDSGDSAYAVWRSLRQRLETGSDAPHWVFWINWYERSLKGEAQDWSGLLAEVALIEDDVWAKGLVAVGRRIEALEHGPREELRSFRAIIEQLQMQTSTVIERVAKAELAADTSLTRLGVAKLAFEDAERDARKTLSDIQNSIVAFQASYEQNVVSSDAYELWDKKREHHEARKYEAYRRFQIGLGVVGAFLVGLVLLLLFGGDFLDTHLLPKCPAGRTCPSFSSRSIFATVAVLTLLTLGLWFVRLKMKEYLSERHLELDAQERVAFTRTYLGLLSDSDSSQAAQDSQALVYGAIFRPSSDGIIKEEGGLDPSVAAAISKFLSK